MDQQERRAAKSFLDYWQLWLVLLGALATCFRFYYRVEDVDAKQNRWQEGSEIRRKETHDVMDGLDNRLIRVEKDLEWIKRGTPCSTGS